jgi:CBS domain-containing protein
MTNGNTQATQLTVADLMTDPVQVIDRNDPIAIALQHMQTHGVRSLIVDRLNPTVPYGILTERDIAYRVFARGLDPWRVRVHDIMRQPCIAVEPTLSLQAAAQLFSETGIQRAPVVQDNVLLGIISVTDFVMKLPCPPPSPADLAMASKSIGAYGLTCHVRC